MFGFMTAVDTFLAQSFGAGQLKNYGIWTGNSLVIVLLATLVASGVMALCGPFMHLIVSDPDLANGAQAFALRLIPGLFPYFLFKVMSKYLQTQHILAPSTLIGLLANIINATFNWSLIYRAGWGIAGSPWATTLTRTTEFALICLYMAIKRNSVLGQTWPTCENLSSEQVRPFMQIALPGALAFLGKFSPSLLIRFHMQLS
jgi:MATE family multidrug resistance protein